MKEIANANHITWTDYGKLALLAGGIILGCALVVKAVSFVIGLVCGIMLRIFCRMQGISIGGI
nr:hypothetical protein [uncultured archaeon]